MIDGHIHYAECIGEDRMLSIIEENNLTGVGLQCIPKGGVLKVEENAKSFFEKYQDRILYGTDIGARSVIKKEKALLSIEESRARVSLVTGFLEEKGEYLLYPDAYYAGDSPRVMHGLGLSQVQLKKMYEENFLIFIDKI